MGLVPFRMGRVRTPPLPPIPGWSDFPVLNVRTYVRGPDGREGVWFFSLACPRRAFVAAMRCVGLHYAYADAQVSRTTSDVGDAVQYRFAGRSGPSRSAWHLEARAAIGRPIDDAVRTPLLDSLIGRWAANSRPGGRWWRTPISHEPWPLHEAPLDGDLHGPLVAAGIPLPEGPPMTHYSPGVDSRIGLPRLGR